MALVAVLAEKVQALAEQVQALAEKVQALAAQVPEQRPVPVTQQRVMRAAPPLPLPRGKVWRVWPYRRPTPRLLMCPQG